MKKLALLISTASVLALASPVKALYVFTPSTGGIVDPAGTPVSITSGGGDNGLATVTVPFNFSIYNTPVSAGQTITVSTNGNIQFIPTGGSLNALNTVLPSDSFGVGVPVIMPYWDDLTLTSGGIFTSTSGAVGSRVFDIEWRGRRVGETAGTQTINFEVRFFENSNNFQIVYAQTGIGSSLNGQGATVGVQAGRSPSPFTQYSFNQPNITPGLTLTATATPVPFGFSPVTALAFIGANLVRRRSKSVKPEKVTH